MLVLDINLPGMKGADLQKALVTSGSTRPIAFITSYEDACVRQEVLDWGATALLQKSVDERIFLGAIEAASQGQTNRNDW